MEQFEVRYRVWVNDSEGERTLSQWTTFSEAFDAYGGAWKGNFRGTPVFLEATYTLGRKDIKTEVLHSYVIGEELP